MQEEIAGINKWQNKMNFISNSLCTAKLLCKNTLWKHPQKWLVHWNCKWRVDLSLWVQTAECFLMDFITFFYPVHINTVLDSISQYVQMSHTKYPYDALNICLSNYHKHTVCEIWNQRPFWLKHTVKTCLTGTGQTHMGVIWEVRADLVWIPANFISGL